VDFVQWITTPDGIDKILLRKGNSLYFITIPNVPGAYPIIGSPISCSSIANYGLNDWTNTTTFDKTEFYYHGDTLCCYALSKASNRTYFYHWDSDRRTFVSDLSLSLASYYTFYSDYNGAINILYKDSTFIGDYRWYIITPMSDLYTYFNYNPISNLFNQEINTNNTAKYPVAIVQIVDVVYFVFINRNSSNYIYLSYVNYDLPSITTALININNGKPNSAITGYLSIEGDLYYPDFQWEVATKKSFNIYVGKPELMLTEPSIVNLRLTPSMSQTIENITYQPLDNSDVSYSYIDERTTNFSISGTLLSNYLQVDISLLTAATSPFILLTIGGETMRHCLNNSGVMCFASRSEFKTSNCNEACPFFVKKNVVIDIVQDGQSIEGTIYDEREVFPDYQQNAILDIRLYE
jgi:hypothetical protein